MKELFIIMWLSVVAIIIAHSLPSSKKYELELKRRAEQTQYEIDINCSEPVL